MIDIIWVLETRELPGVGVVQPGEIYNVEYALAMQLVKQGDALLKDAKSKSKKET